MARSFQDILNTRQSEVKQIQALPSGTHWTFRIVDAGKVLKEPATDEDPMWFKFGLIPVTPGEDVDQELLDPNWRQTTGIAIMWNLRNENDLFSLKTFAENVLSLDMSGDPSYEEIFGSMKNKMFSAPITHGKPAPGSEIPQINIDKGKAAAV